MRPDTRPKLGKGVKLRRDRDGGVMLLVPEGALVLNSSAAVALELVDGERTLSQIVETVGATVRSGTGARARRHHRSFRPACRTALRPGMSAPAPLAALRAHVPVQSPMPVLL